MKKDMQIKAAIAATIASLAIVLSGCASTQKSSERGAALEQAQNEETVRNSEPIPPPLAAQAASTFRNGKPFFIWRTEEGPVHVAYPATATIKVHYAIAPDIQVHALPLPATATWFKAHKTGQNESVTGAKFKEGTTLHIDDVQGHGQLAVYFIDCRAFVVAPTQPISNVLMVELERE